MFWDLSRISPGQSSFWNLRRNFWSDHKRLLVEELLAEVQKYSQKNHWWSFGFISGIPSRNPCSSFFCDPFEISEIFFCGFSLKCFLYSQWSVFCLFYFSKFSVGIPSKIFYDRSRSFFQDSKWNSRRNFCKDFWRNF